MADTILVYGPNFFNYNEHAIKPECGPDFDSSRIPYLPSTYLGDFGQSLQDNTFPLLVAHMVDNDSSHVLQIGDSMSRSGAGWSYS